MIVTPAYIAPLTAAAFTVNGFPLPEVEIRVGPGDKTSYHAYTVKDDGRHFAWAELLSPRSPEDAIERLAREILRNRQ